MNLIEALILALIQGITEWLPVSSSAHLAIAQHFFGLKENIAYDALLHFASVIVICLVFWKDIIKALQDRKYIFYLAIATIPVVIAGLLIKPYIQAIFNNLILVGAMLLITGIMLLLARETGKNKPAAKSSILIGLVQAVAILPGISRSGSTICAGLFAGLKKEEAIRFSFLLAIPALLGAGILNIGEMEFSYVTISGALLTIGIGYLSLKLLVRIVQRNQLKWFGYYCLALGLALLAAVLGIQ